MAPPVTIFELSPVDLRRFWEKVEVRAPDECWPWRASVAGKGPYGQFYLNGKVRKAHVVAWVAAHGPLAWGLELDHICELKVCCNPAHLDPVTHAVNVQRAARRGAYSRKVAAA